MKILFGILILLTGNTLNAESDIREKLDSIEGISVSEISTNGDFSACFKIMIKQPINHSDTTQGFFYQKIYLTHKSMDSPMLLNVNGYISFSNKISPWAISLQSNQIFVEHRYFGESKPDFIDYEI